MSKPGPITAKPLSTLLGGVFSDVFAKQGFASRELVTRWAEIALQLLNLFACFAGALACLFALGHVAMVVAAGTP